MPQLFTGKMGKQFLQVVFVIFKWHNMGKTLSLSFGRVLIKCHFHFEYLKHSYYLTMIAGSTLQEYLSSLVTFKLSFYAPGETLSP